MYIDKPYIKPIYYSHFQDVEGIPAFLPNLQNHFNYIEEKKKNKKNWYTSEQVQYVDYGPYRHHYKKRCRYLQQVIEMAISEGCLPSTMKILDLGCGDGADLRWMSRYAGLLVGVDYNIERLIRAKTFTWSLSIDFYPYLCDILNIPFVEGFFDLIYMNHVIEHMHEDEKALRAAYSLLNDNGIAILGVPNEDVFFWRLAYFLSPNSRKQTDHVNFYNTNSIERKCKTAGFRVKNITHIGYGLPNWRFDSLVRKFKFIDDLLEQIGKKFFPKQATSLYLILDKK